MVPDTRNNPFGSFSIRDGDYSHPGFVDVDVFQDCVICRIPIDK